MSMNDKLSWPLGEKTLWQRVYITASVFGGFAAAWWAFSSYPDSMFTTYDKVNATFQERLEATRTAILELKAAQQDNGLTSAQITANLEKDLIAIGEEYSSALKAVPKARENQMGQALIVVMLFGVIVGGLIQLVGWMIEGIGMHRRYATKAKTRVHPVHLVSSEPAQESHQALPTLNPTQQKNP